MPLATSEYILKLMYALNPWWRTEALPKEMLKPIKRFAWYEAMHTLNQADMRRYVFLSGARRVGKTTLLYQMIDDLLKKGVNAKQILYLSLDHPLLKFCALDEVVNLFEAGVSPGEAAYLFLDELPYVPEGEKWLKRFYETKPEWRIAVTGSIRPLAPGPDEDGAGCWNFIPMPPLSFYEYCELLGVDERPKLDKVMHPAGLVALKETEHKHLFYNLDGLQKHFHRYLAVGGFPELALAKDDFYVQRSLREDVMDKILKQDIPSLFNVRNMAVLEKLFWFLCYNSTRVINVAALGKELDNSTAGTVVNALQCLERAHLIYTSEPVNLDGKKTARIKPKVYIADAAIRNAALIPETGLLDLEELEVMVESSVYKHLQTYYCRAGFRIGYGSKPGDEERDVDVMVEGPLTRIVTEVKYCDNTEIMESDPIAQIAGDPKLGVTAAMVVTKNLDDYGLVPGKSGVPLMKIPAHAFLYLLGHAEKTEYLERK